VPPTRQPAPPLARDACYRALRTRDARFDGRFYAGVLTTGIFCRPVCPARTPRPEHCVFFPSAAAAQAAGFRPCLRCRPELAPGVAGWRGTANTVARALALIADGAWGEEDDVEDLASRIGVGGRHLRRLFTRHVGAPPIAVAQAHRVLLAKRLLADTTLPMSEVATAAGFRSLRRFNAVVRRTYGRPPSSLRRRALPAADADADISLRLPHTTPYGWRELLAFLASRAVPGLEQIVDGTYRRTLTLGDARAVVAARSAPAGDHLAVTLRLSAVSALPAAVGALRRLFDLDADVAVIGAHLSQDPLLAPLVRRRPGLRVPGAADAFELAVRAILGQQVSVAAARTLTGRIVAAIGAPVPEAMPGEPALAFPRPAALADADLSRVGLPRARAAAIRALARSVADDPATLETGPDLATTAERLAELPGVGPWTAQYIALRAMREPDAFPGTDLGLVRAAARLGPPLAPAALAERAEAWRPWRAYAALHLWTADANLDGGNT
jgi:AraC family transcriptional regulator of adaptative response / DNA-3-methyladenine glycosylase II